MLIEELVTQLESGRLETPPVRYAEDSVFIEKVHMFEHIYGLTWFEFVRAYDEHSVKPCSDREKLDFAEWRMLCDKFEQKLADEIAGLTIMASPPLEEELLITEGPSNRAFCFVRLSFAYGPLPQGRTQAETAGERAVIF